MKKRTLISVFAALALTATMGVMAACSTEGTSNTSGTSSTTSDTSSNTASSNTASSDSGSTTPDPVTVSYQFTGYYGELKAMFSDFYFMGNLMSDGTGTMYIYGTTLDEVEITKWSVKTTGDETVMTVKDTVNPDGKYEVTQNADGSFTIEEYLFYFAGSYSRKVELTGTTTQTYESKDDFVAKVDAIREAEPIAEYVSGDTTTLKFYKNGKAEFSPYGQNAQEFTWAYENDTLTFSGENAPQAEITVDAENRKATITITVDYGTYGSFTFPFTDIDITKLMTNSGN